MMIDCSRKVVQVIEARMNEIKAGRNGGDLKKFAMWVSEALAYTAGEWYSWKTWVDWSQTADGAVCDAVLEAWTDFPYNVHPARKGVSK